MHRSGRDRCELLRDLHTLYREGALGHWSDARLVEQFASDRSEQAFAALVDRHGSMVLRVCRAVAGDAHAAEDAFQAVFLVLASKAGSLRVREGLGPWLRTVAIRVATNARHAESRRKRREGLAVRDDRVEDRHPDPDLAHALHAEIDRLPARLREVVLTCDVEGLTYSDAARRLGYPVGTVKSRHSRGRAQLRERLARRGIAPAAFLAATVTESLSAAVPGILRSCTIRDALILASGGPSDGMAPVLAHLVSEGTKAMFARATMMMKLSLTVVGAILGLGATLVAVSAQGTDRAPESSRPTTATPAASDAPVSRPGPAPASHASRPANAVEEPDLAEFVDKPPSNSEVFDELVKQKFPGAQVHVEQTQQTLEDVRDYPLAGRCQQLTSRYKCTIDYLADPQTRRREQEVVYIDKTFLRRIPTSAANRPATQEPPPRVSDPAPAGDQERRLRVLEEKLDRVLKVLEANPAARSSLP
jgi:RNA polymerase sigma factor (sigma-70 family)